MTTGQYVFARFYGYTLGRRHRNAPAEACRDAITMYMITTGVPATLAVLVFVGAISPGLLTTKDWIPWVTVPSGILLYSLYRPLKRYAQAPEIAAPFRSAKSRRITMAAYFGVLIGCILTAGMAGRFLLHATGSR